MKKQSLQEISDMLSLSERMDNCCKKKYNLKGSPNQSNGLLFEMARVGFIGGSLEVYVRTDDGGNIPHVHIRDTNTQGEEFETCVQLEKNAYFLHGKYKDKMNTSQRKSFAEFMESPSKTKRYNTNYEFAIDMWNANNSNVNIEVQYDENGNPIIPNYRTII